MGKQIHYKGINPEANVLERDINFMPSDVVTVQAGYDYKGSEDKPARNSLNPKSKKASTATIAGAIVTVRKQKTDINIQQFLLDCASTDEDRAKCASLGINVTVNGDKTMDVVFPASFKGVGRIDGRHFFVPKAE